MSLKNNPFKQSQNLWQISFNCKEEEIPTWEEYFEEKSLAFITTPKDDEWLVEVIVNEPHALNGATIKKIEDKDWLREVASSIGDIKTPLFHIARTKPEKSELTPIIINNPRAFGMGDHTTTIASLNALEDLYKSNNLKPDQIMDIGTGSGILAIAAKKLFANSNVHGIDICSEAVEISKDHAKLNETNIEFGLDIEKYKNQQYDLIMANILANPLIEMAKMISKMLKKDGYIIMSGFTSNQLESVEKIYKKCLLNTVKISQKDDWIVITMQKS